MILKKRRAVGGLISLIGIIIVFGIVSIAYLDLSSAQTGLINTSLESNQRLFDKNNIRLNVTDITPDSGNNEYDLVIDNLSSDTITIHSYLVDNDLIISKGELNNSINSGSAKSISLYSSDVSTTNIITIVTDLGKKCVFPVDVSYRLC